MASCNALAPFGHSRPSLTGLSGSPSSWSSSTVPFDAFLVYATSAQPTAQYGQTEWDTVAPSMRRRCLTCVALSSLKPSGENPSAPVLVALSWRNSRRVTSTSISLRWGPPAPITMGLVWPRPAIVGRRNRRPSVERTLGSGGLLTPARGGGRAAGQGRRGGARS